MSDVKPSAELTVGVLVATISNWISILLRKWLLLLAVGICCGLLGILYAWMQKPLYTAELTFALEEDGGGGLSAYAGIAAQFGFDIGGGGGSVFSSENLVELMKSKRMVEQTLFTPIDVNNKKITMANYYLDTKVRKGDKVKPELARINFDENYKPGNNRYADSILNGMIREILKSQLTINKIDKKVNIISVKFKDGDEVFAKNFVEQLANTVIQYYVDYRSKKTRQSVEILQRKTDSVKHLISYGMGAVAASNDLNVNPLRQTVRVGAQRKQVDLQVNGALYTELVKNLELSKLALGKETPLIQVIDVPIYPLDKKKLGRLKGGMIFAIIGGLIAAIIIIFKETSKRKTALS